MKFSSTGIMIGCPDPADSLHEVVDVHFFLLLFNLWPSGQCNTKRMVHWNVEIARDQILIIESHLKVHFRGSSKLFWWLVGIPTPAYAGIMFLTLLLGGKLLLSYVLLGLVRWLVVAVLLILWQESESRGSNFTQWFFTAWASENRVSRGRSTRFFLMCVVRKPVVPLWDHAASG